MKKGDFVRVALAGDTGKPRPTLIFQDETVVSERARVILVPLTSVIEPLPAFRVTVWPTDTNGLRVVSQIMIDRITSVDPGKIGGVIGQIDDMVLAEVTRRLLILMGVR